MKKNYNTLSKYIFEYSEREYRKETIEGLFRSVLQPVISNQKIEAYVFLKLNKTEPFESMLTRLKFSGAEVFGFSENIKNNYTKEKLWGQTEFIVVLSRRYSACLIWDYSLSAIKGTSNICLLYNSKIISDITKTILENSNLDIKDILEKYQPDRRENQAMNISVNKIADILDDKNQDVISIQNENYQMSAEDDTYKTAEIVADKAKFIAHEIKNNLSIINLYSKIIEKRLQNEALSKEVSEAMENSLKNITNASENVSSLIGDLRCLSTPYMTEISLKQLVDTVALMSREKADIAKVGLSVDDFSDKTIFTDKIKLECALTNVIFNAIEACSQGCKIKIQVVQTDSFIEIHIRNNGEVITDDIKSKIFEPEFTTKSKGNGLGLAICKRQMQLINGDIVLEYSTKQETSFVITIPV